MEQAQVNADMLKIHKKDIINERKGAQRSAKECKGAQRSAKGRKGAQRSAKER